MFEKIKKAIIHPGKILPYLWRKRRMFYYYFSKSGYSSMPSTIFISINSICNARCKMCDVGQGIQDSTFYQNLICKDRPDLSLNRLKELIKEVKDFKPKIAIISTEPLLYKDLIEFSKYVIDNGLKLQITTNGLLLEKFAKQFVEIGLRDLWVSLDGPPKIHNEIRRVPQLFEKATSGLKIIEQEKKKLKKKFPKLYINYTISNYNYHCLVDFMKSIKNLAINGVCLSHLNFVTDKMAQLHNRGFSQIGQASPTSISLVNLKEIDVRVLSEQLKEVRDMRDKYNLNVNFSPPIFSVKEIEDYYHKPEKVISKKQCTVAWESVQIIANGDLIPMTRCFNVKLGNIYHATFKEIWNGQKIREFRKALKKHKYFPSCTRCCALLE